MTATIKGQTFSLYHQKAVFWEEEKSLIISDLHLGKSQHFRKGGVGLPRDGDVQNLRRLKSLIEVLKPKSLLLLGDLFHSEENCHVDEVADLLDQYPGIEKRLIIGNHDIMDRKIYNDLGLELDDETLCRGPFLFAHEPLESKPENGLYPVCGHIHPGVRLTGRGRQSVTLPCFYFGENQAVLPAFGNFTGLYRIKPSKEDRVYAIAGRKIISVA